MGRLTKNTEKNPKDGLWFIDNHMDNINYAGLFYIGVAVDKLAAYEDIGEPEELATLAKEKYQAQDLSVELRNKLLIERHRREVLERALRIMKLSYTSYILMPNQEDALQKDINNIISQAEKELAEEAKAITITGGDT